MMLTHHCYKGIHKPREQLTGVTEKGVAKLPFYHISRPYLVIFSTKEKYVPMSLWGLWIALLSTKIHT